LSWSQLVRTEQGAAPGPVAIAPSLLACDFSRIAEEIAAVESEGVEFLHLDVMDGHFVPNITFGPPVIGAMNQVATVTLDTHLMIEQPDRYIEAFLDAGSHVLTVHAEASADVARDLAAIRARGRYAGLAMNPDKSFDLVEPWLEHFDLLLVMSVFPGFGGQKFMPEVLRNVERAAEAREKNGLGFAIEIDGGINPATAALARDAGVDILVAGTAIFGKENYGSAIREIRGAVSA
jgi:ribulose-phosphate 3-epimerase